MVLAANAMIARILSCVSEEVHLEQANYRVMDNPAIPTAGATGSADGLMTGLTSTSLNYMALNLYSEFTNAPKIRNQMRIPGPVVSQVDQNSMSEFLWGELEDNFDDIVTANGTPIVTAPRVYHWCVYRINPINGFPENRDVRWINTKGQIFSLGSRRV
jgi:hypothetical protein